MTNALWVALLVVAVNVIGAILQQRAKKEAERKRRERALAVPRSTSAPSAEPTAARGTGAAVPAPPPNFQVPADRSRIEPPRRVDAAATGAAPPRRPAAQPRAPVAVPPARSGVQRPTRQPGRARPTPPPVREAVVPQPAPLPAADDPFARTDTPTALAPRPTSSARERARDRADAQVEGLVERLRRADGLREAVLLREVLGPPVGLRPAPFDPPS